ncbi:unnamed protein product [Kuraishia capsulata CBS 1993]|uniref:peptidylprolyl isomerase n=1 Tax=Kuraishia capsulata CBS 1993 TaxID=1382522 RepID=W6MKF5_9ASCO|nr:uncharacterized protein KUCA_T00001129001 [Kuraishia capsulata CBS 1993]CDK25162.1 unnamed protein product [Kuraishia capsulata CBS 1993]
MVDATKYAYLDISLNQKPIGRVVVELFTEKAPQACLNFMSLCGDHTGQEIPGLYLKRNYNHTKIHRAVKNFAIEGGDVVSDPNSPEVGSRGSSIYAQSDNDPGFFEDENLKQEFEEPFLVGMANANSPNTNTSRFFITTSPSPHLNGKHTLFGKVVHGKSVVREVEKVDVSKEHIPKIPCVIEDSGSWKKGDPVPVYNASYDSIGGDIYEEFPDDNTKANAPNFDPENMAQALKAAETIKESGTLLFKKADLTNARFKYAKALRYANELMPDKDQDRETYAKFMDLKKKLFLNLSLCCFKIGDHQRAVDYAGYLLELDDDFKVSALERSKALYRRGMSYLSLKKNSLALESLKEAKLNNPDDVNINSALERAEKIVQDAKERERERYAGLFSS